MSGWRATPALESTETESAGRDAGVSIEELSIRLHDDSLHPDGEHEVGDGVAYRSRRVSEVIALPTPNT